MNKKIMITIIVVIILIVLGIGTYFGYKHSEENKTTGTEWGDYYYQTLSSESKKYEAQVPDEKGEYQTKEFDRYANTNNVNVQFIQIEDNTIPIMAISYEKNNYKQINIYKAIEQENQNHKYTYILSQYPIIITGQEQQADGNYDIQLLYNIEEQRYIWYIHKIDAKNMESFTPIALNGNVYNFTEEEMKTNQVLDNGTPVLSKFEETFIVVDNIDKPIEIGDIHNIDEKVLKEHIKSAEKQYKDTNTIITDEIKTATQNKRKEIENKKEQIKVAQEEKAKKEADEKAKAEEETKKKAEEEAKKKVEKNVLKAGNYTLKYGIYTGTSGNYTYNLELKEDGTFGYSTGNAKPINNGLKFSLYYADYYNNYIIALPEGGLYEVTGNNTLKTEDYYLHYKGK